MRGWIGSQRGIARQKWPAPSCERLEVRSLLAAFTVTSNDDISDGTCDLAHCSLREAIEAANSNAGADVIQFNIPGTGVPTIAPDDELPTVTDPLTIDGTTQSAGRIELDGTSAGAETDALAITAGNSAVRGLVINRFSGNGIVLSGGGGNRIEGNWIGTDASGRFDAGNGGNGLLIRSANNTVGGTSPSLRNVISGNQFPALFVGGASATGNVVQGNYIGIDATGTAELRNAQEGVVVRGAPRNTIGGEAAGAGNVISANGLAGIAILEAGAAENIVTGNLIGTDPNGASAMGNLGGIFIEDAPDNTIGGASAAARNIISGNDQSGVVLFRSGATRNHVEGNLIGTDAAGTASVGNGEYGVYIQDATHNTIGGTAAGAGNVISASGLDGVIIFGAPASGNAVEGNRIGTDDAGSAALPNLGNGVFIFGAPANRIGGASAGARNVISGNGSAGVTVLGSAASMNVVQGNFIGSDVAGMNRLGNGSDGVSIQGASHNTIGGTATGAGNAISGNRGPGIRINGSSTMNAIVGNFIGTDVMGTMDRGNGQDGVSIEGSSDNTIGGSSAGARNVISGNDGFGVRVSMGGESNRIYGNFIGTDETGSAPLGNAIDGVRIENSPDNSIGGATAGERNVISGNRGTGVFIAGPDLLGWTVGWWRAEGDADDSGINSNHGVLRDGTGFSPTGVVGRAFLLDGVNDFVELGRDASLAGQAGFTVEAWVRTTDTEGTILQQRQADEAGHAGFNGEYVLSVGNVLGAGSEGKVCWVTFGDSQFGFQFCSQRFINDSIYHHIVGVREFDGTGKLYVDGVLDSVQASPPRALDASLRVVVGGDTRDNLHFLRGEVDEVSIYKRALRGDEIQTLFRIGAGTWPGNLVQGNFIGTDSSGTAAMGNSEGVSINNVSNNLIGGTAPGAGNVISGGNLIGIDVFGERATGNLIQGNVIGADATGTRALGNVFAGVSLLLAPRNTIGGTVAGAGNLISGNGNAGINVNGLATETLIQGNFIGTDATGTADLGNRQQGVVIYSANNTIGGSTAGARNVISGNDAEGILLFSVATIGNQVLGNFIGTDASGTAALGNISHGVAVDQFARDNTVGGTCGNSANTIAFNGGDGVRVNEVFGAPTGFAVRCNSIHSNFGLGINLGTDGVTANDLGDTDRAANNQQNFPTLTTVSTKRGVTNIRGALNSTPNTMFRIEFFSNTQLDPSGNGEGQTVLGAIDVRTSRRGTVSIKASLRVAVAPGLFITATATDPNGNTSEFSPGVRLAGRPPGVAAFVAADRGRVVADDRHAIDEVLSSPDLGRIIFAFRRKHRA